ncbi:hypothetical protein QYE76_069861 [Lolium multiflorum]|uniref:DUF4216 domain-containing protein n=1 Tax=Lolium multiflorum TaxID=4521 RepID=A0AAD8SH61_LOLMU|nr:hypothetical protein QYE76_069861 [Lolium multiflorum]
MGEDEAEEEPIFDEPIFDDPDDDLGRAILDAKISCGSEKERLKLEKMLEDHKTLLYPNCEDGQKKLGTTLELLQWKAENGTSDKGFEKLLKIIKKMLPGENVLPSSTYEVKKVVCPLGLEVQKIHACINDCILYRGEYENLNACPVCSALRYKIRRDDPGDVEGESTPRKSVPAKLYLLAKQPSSTISTFQGYEINGNTFYMFAQDKKSTNQNSGVRFDAADDNGKKVTYYGYIEEIWELEYGPNFKVPLFRCKWFNLKDGVQVDPQYGMTTVDLKNLGAAEESPVASRLQPDLGKLLQIGVRGRLPGTRRAARLLRTSTRPAVGCGGAAGLSGRHGLPWPPRYPQSQPTRALPPRFDYRDPDANDDDDGDYDDYSGEYYRARHEYD